MAVWARNAERWDALPKLWTMCAETSELVPAEFYAVFAELPTEARGAQPVLTWMSAIAAAETVTPRSKRTEVFLDRIILDSAQLHADWESRESTDIALEAGVLRMVGQRHLPPSGGPLEAAWRAKQQLDEFVDARSRAGQPPTPDVHSLFRLMSARLSIMRADLTGAVAESHWGGVLAVSEPAVKLAAAIESLARSLAGQVRDGLRRSLEPVSIELATVSGFWAGRVGLESMATAIWGDPAPGLNRLMAALADQPIGAREQDEPMGGMLLGRSRSLLLCRFGAFEAAAARARRSWRSAARWPRIRRPPSATRSLSSGCRTSPTPQRRWRW